MTTPALARFAELIDPATAYNLCVAGFVFCALVLIVSAIVAAMGDPSHDAS